MFALYAHFRTIDSTPNNKKFTLKEVLQISAATRLSKDYEALLFWYPHVTYCIDWDKLMASKNNRPDFNLIDYRLSDLELEKFEDWISKSPMSIPAMLAEFAKSDYKISFSWVDNSEALCCSITGKEDAKFNSKSTLTTWSDDPTEALAMALFKVFSVFSGGVWKAQAQSRRG